MLNHKQARIFIETFLYEYFGKKNIYIIDATNTLRNEGRPDAFTNFSFVIGANFRADEDKFARQVSDVLFAALRENFDDCSVGIDWTDWTGESYKDGEEKIAEGFPEARICVNVY